MTDSLDLTESKRDKLQGDSTDRLGYVLQSLHEADEISDDVDWETELWDGCTVEEVIGALVEAEGLAKDSLAATEAQNVRLLSSASLPDLGEYVSVSHDIPDEEPSYE
ncbi:MULTISPECIES: hypothetical protein [Halobacterium]|uniref:hypothetical protein n=1 Tax=Halobacterium TaxID=2239 RepID=UPI00073E6C1B|nr:MULTISPECIES: hypothetical protein [Halobacterium]MCG1002889.1 hypothetical protein [Halobacterium noricense]